MLKRPELGQLCDYLSELAASVNRDEQSQAETYQPLVCFKSSGNKPPVFFVLADDRPVYALRARGFEPGESTDYLSTGLSGNDESSASS